MSTFFNSQLRFNRMNEKVILVGRMENKDAITLSAGDNTLAFGGPFQLHFSTTRSGSAIQIAQVEVIGVAGEKYTGGFGNEDGLVFADFIRGGGKGQELCKLEYG